MFVSDRSFFNCIYLIDGSEPGEFQFIMSGQGNEELTKKHGPMRAGKDVIGMLNLNYMRISPLYDEHGEELVGSLLEQVVSMNPAGSMPEWLKVKMIV